jgi:predicted Rossmann-fold nucleotide-binding protein
LGMHRKSIGLLNVAAFFDPLLAWLDHMVREDFLKPTHRRLVRVAADGEGLLDLLLTSPPPQRTPKWITDDQR